MSKLGTCTALLLGASIVAGGSAFARQQEGKEAGGFSTRIQRVPVIVNGTTLGEDALMLKAVWSYKPVNLF